MTRNDVKSSRLPNMKKISKSTNNLGGREPDIFSAENY